MTTLFWLLYITVLFALSRASDGTARISWENDYKCSLFTFVPFTSVSGGQRVSALPFLNEVGEDNPGYNQMTSALLAMEEFNTKSTSIILEMSLFHDCPVTFDMQNSRFFDGGTNGHIATQSLIQAGFLPCAIAGPFNDQPAMDMQTLAAAARIPHVVTRAYNARVASVADGPFTSMIFPDILASMEVLKAFLDYHGRTDFISFVYSLEDANIQQREVFAIFMDQKMTRWNSFAYKSGLDRREIIDALRGVKESGYRTIVVSMNSPLEGEIQALADAAEELGMNNRDGSEYMWVWFGVFHPEALYTGNDNLNQLLKGSGWFLPNVFDEANPFEVTWRAGFNESFYERVNQYNPIQSLEQPGYWKADATYTESNGPEFGSKFLFDAIMSIGAGACLSYYYQSGLGAQIETRFESFFEFFEYFFGGGGQGYPSIDDLRAFVGEDYFAPITESPVNVTIPVEEHRDLLRESAFLGASGYVTFNQLNEDNDASTRTGEGISWLVINFWPPGKVNPQTGEPVDIWISDVYVPSDTSNPWLELDGFVFADGSSEPPILLRTTPDQNYLPRGVHILGLTMMSIAIAFALVVMVWVYVKREHRVIRAAQPIFIYVLCIGAILEASAIFPLSFDESYGWSDSQLSSACASVPWLTSTGFIMTYGMLFAKLWRVQRVMQFTRRKIEIKHVIWPVLILGGCVLLVLSLWTGIDPLRWNRNTVDEDTGESIGECTGDHPSAFVIPLVLLALIPVLLTGYMAWMTKDVDDAYSESYWIFILFVVQLEVIIVATPVIIILRETSSVGRYLGMTLIWWVIPMSTLMLIMLPKFLAVYRKADRSSQLRSNVGMGQVRVTGVNIAAARQTAVSNLSTSSPEGRPRNTASSSEEIVAGKFLPSTASGPARLQQPEESPVHTGIPSTDDLASKDLPASAAEDNLSYGNETTEEPASIGSNLRMTFTSNPAEFLAESPSSAKSLRTDYSGQVVSGA